MEQFTVSPKSIKYLETSQGVAFSAQLNLDGKKFGTIENDGRGGGTYTSYPNPAGRDLLDEAAKEKFPKAGSTVAENYLEYLMDVAEGVNQ